MKKALAALVILFPLSVEAKVKLFNGTYSTKEACDWSKLPSKDQNTPESDKYAFIDGESMNGWGWRCEFLNGWRASNGDISVIAACAWEADAWTDTYLIRRYIDGYRVMEKRPDGTTNIIKFPVRCE